MNGKEQKAFIKNNISYSSRCEQLAEECCELAQAALKISRSIHKDNPTSKNQDELIENLIEEIADVLLVLDVIDASTIFRDEIMRTKRKKLYRWVTRIQERDNNA